MGYFDDLQFLAADEAPRCQAHIQGGRFAHYAVQLIWASPEHAMCYAVHPHALHTLSSPHWSWHQPGTPYQYRPHLPGDYWHHFWVAFKGKRGQALVQEGFIPLSSTGLLPVIDLDLARHRFRRLIALVLAGNNQAEAVLLLESLLAQAMQESRPAVPADLQRLAASIDADPARNWDFQHEAKLRGWTYHHFRRQFRLAHHHAPQAYVLLRRLQRAALALRHGQARIADIAASAGYANAAQFSRLFRKHFGSSPREFRSGSPSYGQRSSAR